MHRMDMATTMSSLIPVLNEIFNILDYVKKTIYITYECFADRKNHAAGF